MPVTTPRIRWTADKYGWNGYVGMVEPRSFQIWKEEHRLVLSSGLLGQFTKVAVHPDDPEPLKAEAETWLTEFVASIGAQFPAIVT